MNDRRLRLGVAKVDITPTQSVPLAGFSHRSGTFQGVTRPLHARIFLLENSGERYLLVTADLIWWGDNLLEPIRDVVKKHGIPANHILLHATHNHSGPQTSDQFTPSLGSLDSSYLSLLIEKVDEGVRKAIENLEHVSVERGKGVWVAGVNRRKVVDGKLTMAPHYNGVNDPTVTVIRFKRVDSTTKGLLVHATCHPTTTDENWISSEFPGYAMDALESWFLDEGVVAGYLQGFCADIRPALVKEGQFFRGSNVDVERVGQQLVDEAMTILDRKMKSISINEAYLTTRTINLPFSHVPDRNELSSKRNGEGITGEWSRFLLGKKKIPEDAELKMSYFSLSDQLAFLTVNAEMVVEYGYYVQKLMGDKVLPIGYTNGITGYIPTAVQLDEGGYEPIESTLYFGMPSPFSKEIESLITAGLKEIKDR